MARTLSYTDALKILGEGDSKTLAAIDKLLGAGIVVAAAGTGQVELLTLLHVRSELVPYARRLLNALGQRARGARGRDRTDLLVAAHTVLIVTAYIETLPASVTGVLRLTDELSLAGSTRREDRLVDALLAVPSPPSPGVSYERYLRMLEAFYKQMSDRLLTFLARQRMRDEDGTASRQDSLKVELDSAAGSAIRRYEEDLRRLAADCPEFWFWMLLRENAATRQEIIDAVEAQAGVLAGNLKGGLAGLFSMLERLTAAATGADWPERLARAYGVYLQDPIADENLVAALDGLVAPKLGEVYVNPGCLTAAANARARPADDSWWAEQPRCDDVQWVLVRYLTSPQAPDLPLVVLGQPGSGKSALTKVLAARLPPSGFLPVRVELRHMPADDSLQDHVERAIREETGSSMNWPQLVEAAEGRLPVLMLDGFDELLQATKASQFGYLEQVRQFQRRELAQGRPVAVIVTSRIAVADRVSYPEDTTVVRLEPFTPEQTARWLAVWNRANAPYFFRSGAGPLPPTVALDHEELASQPLLLLMLALYDAGGNPLTRHQDPLVRRQKEIEKAQLYERLLHQFARREVAWRHPDTEPDGLAVEVAQELKRLSVVAFAMFNRGRQFATDDEIEADLKVLLGEMPAEAVTPGSGQPLTQAQLQVGRFFFVHESHAIVGQERRPSYEFVHATFGEYLIARLIRNVTRDLVASADRNQPPGSDLRPGDDESLLHALLSRQPLTDRQQIITFMDHLLERPDDRLRELLVRLFGTVNHARRPGIYDAYAPGEMDVPSRHACYAANLLILITEAGSVHASDLYPGASDPVECWRQQAGLWKACLSPQSWQQFVPAFDLERKGTAPDRDLHVMRSLYFGDHQWHMHEREKSWEMSWWLDPGDLTRPWDSSPLVLVREQEFRCDFATDVLLHAAEAVTAKFPDSLFAFCGHNSEFPNILFSTNPSPKFVTGPVFRSAAHLLVALRTRVGPENAESLAAAYTDAIGLIIRLPSSMQLPYMALLVDQLCTDVPDLPPGIITMIIADLVDLHPAHSTLVTAAKCLADVLVRIDDPAEPLRQVARVIDEIEDVTHPRLAADYLHVWERLTQFGESRLASRIWQAVQPALEISGFADLAHFYPMAVVQALRLGGNSSSRLSGAGILDALSGLPEGAIRTFTKAEIDTLLAGSVADQALRDKAEQIRARWAVAQSRAGRH